MSGQSTMKLNTAIVAGLCGALAIAAIVEGVLWIGLHSAGRVQAAHFTGDAGRVVVVDRQRSTRSAVARVRIHDVLTGAELVRGRLSSGWGDRNPGRTPLFDCIPAAGNRIWCSDMSGDDGLSLRRLDTLAVVAGEDQLHRLAPGLAQGLLAARPGAGQAPMVDLDDGSLLVTGKDGRLYRIGSDLRAQLEPPRTYDQGDAKSFAKWGTDTLHMENLSLPAHAVAFDHGSGLVHRVHLGGATLRLEQPAANSPRAVLTVTIHRQPAPDAAASAGFDPDAAHDAGVVPGSVAPHPGQTFLDAGFLADPDMGLLAPVILDGPPSAVLAHYELAKAGRQLILTRVGADAAPGWSRALADDQVLGARLVGRLLVVVLRDSLVGMDPASGAIRYQRSF